MGDDGSRPRLATNLLVILVLLMSVYIAYTGLWPFLRPINSRPREITPRGELADFESTATEIFESASPSVVYIANVRYGQGRLSATPVAGASGTGLIWDDAGHIVTNYHVAANADELVVTLADQASYRAAVVGFSPSQDLAVLRVTAPVAKIVPLPIGESSDLRVGQSVFAIGSPFGLQQTLTTGIVSALNRSVPTEDGNLLEGMIQTDAAINPGNSGGPLLDSAGRLIGVNTVISSPSGANAGVGFAIPVDAVNEIVPQLIEHGRIIRPWVGVQLIPTSYLERQRRIDLPEGLYVDRVTPNSPADHAGLRGTSMERGRVQLGDVVVAVEGRPTTTFDAFRDIINEFEVGDEVTLSIIRGEEKIEAPVTLGPMPGRV
ncbi:MAG: S1C family serine protease [Phycisphaerales bacterium]